MVGTDEGASGDEGRDVTVSGSKQILAVMFCILPVPLSATQL